MAHPNESATQRTGISVVVPVYNSVSTLSVLANEVAAVLEPLGSYEVIFVDDGSRPHTWHAIQEVSAAVDHVRGIRLRRNYGQHSALVAGVRVARFPLTVTLDDDLQNPPSEIPRMVAALNETGFDVVYGVPENVEQSMPRKLAGRLTRIALAHGLGIDSAPAMSSFRAFRTSSRDAFAGDLGTNVSLDALLTWGNSRFGSITVKHEPRAEGSSNYTFKKLVSFAIDTTTGYTTVPLQIASILGLATAAFGFLVLILVVGRPILTGESVPGFPFLASTIALFSGVQLLTLGVLGEYLARMHFRIMHKPTYVIGETTPSTNP